MTADNRERGLDVEDVACDRFPVEPIAEDRDQRNGWHDVEFTESFSGWPAGTPGESKSCFPDYYDRAGRWWIPRDNHEKLLEHDGVYFLSIVERETGRVLRMGVLDAVTMDSIIDGNWWLAGDGGRQKDEYRQIPWTRVFESVSR